jgi:hypothetical protein
LFFDKHKQLFGQARKRFSVEWIARWLPEVVVEPCIERAQAQQCVKMRWDFKSVLSKLLRERMQGVPSGIHDVVVTKPGFQGLFNGLLRMEAEDLLGKPREPRSWPLMHEGRLPQVGAATLPSYDRS